uniref:Uncharacterized protein n=1 Tax=Moniliophthora roreri TaxID=221103 RepID=A0A0W0FMH0_MONRR
MSGHFDEANDRKHTSADRHGNRLDI